MPTYEYGCDACGHAWEVVQRHHGNALKDCPACGKPQARRMISGGTFMLKGGGWYADGYGKAKPSASASTSSDSGKSGGESSKSSAESGKSGETGASKPAESSAASTSSTSSTPAKSSD